MSAYREPVRQGKMPRKGITPMTNNTTNVVIETLSEAATKLSSTKLQLADLTFELARYYGQLLQSETARAEEKGADFHVLNEVFSAFESSLSLELDPKSDIDGIGVEHYKTLGEQLLEELVTSSEEELREEINILFADHASYLKAKKELFGYGQYGQMLYTFV